MSVATIRSCHRILERSAVNGAERRWGAAVPFSYLDELARETFGRAPRTDRYAWHPVSPVIPAPAEDAHAVKLAAAYEPEAVVLDLIGPL
jgi:hypothetical protein